MWITIGLALDLLSRLVTPAAIISSTSVISTVIAALNQADITFFVSVSCVRILYDGKIYQIQSAGGINRYYANLIRDCQQALFLLSPPASLVTFIIQLIQILECFHTLDLVAQGQSHRGLKNSTSALLLILWYCSPTYYTLLTRQDLNKYRCPVVLTVHDLIMSFSWASWSPW